MEKPNYQNLQIWQHGIDLTNLTYEFTNKFPSSERFGLISQMQRSAVSVPSNIAEGYRRNSKPDFKRFLHIALGSLSELETQFVIACQQDYLNKDELSRMNAKTQSLSKMLYSFIKKL